MNNRIILISNESGKEIVVKKFDGINNGDLFQFIYEHKNASASYLLPDVDVDEYIKCIKEIASLDIYNKHLTADEHILAGQLLKKTTAMTWSVVPLENVVYKLSEFIK